MAGIPLAPDRKHSGGVAGEPAPGRTGQRPASSGRIHGEHPSGPASASGGPQPEHRVPSGRRPRQLCPGSRGDPHRGQRRQSVSADPADTGRSQRGAVGRGRPAGLRGGPPDKTPGGQGPRVVPAAPTGPRRSARRARRQRRRRLGDERRTHRRTLLLVRGGCVTQPGAAGRVRHPAPDEPGIPPPRHRAAPLLRHPALAPCCPAPADRPVSAQPQVRPRRHHPAPRAGGHPGRAVDGRPAAGRRGGAAAAGRAHGPPAHRDSGAARRPGTVGLTHRRTAGASPPRTGPPRIRTGAVRAARAQFGAPGAGSTCAPAGRHPDPPRQTSGGP
ncbi:hypothetical protein GA0115253_1033023 [Streptomyces sp. Termitarium-T10T-6]|nr:hypothetical protein GA0115253_1033023 [Streptomyces sp. Termitarium-T10T-6]